MKEEIFIKLKKEKPVIHNITNYVTANDCANVVLAIGGSPIMADCPEEVEEIVAISDSLVINMGTLSKKAAESIYLAGLQANKLGKPVVLDPVGITASKFRLDIAEKLISNIEFAVIRGNYSEIKKIDTIVDECSQYMQMKSSGIDVNDCDESLLEPLKTEMEILDGKMKLAKKLSLKTNSIVVITGKIDVVSDGNIAYTIDNGHELMSRVTGTGCMLTSLIGVFISVNRENLLEAVSTAVASMGIAGEIAVRKMKDENKGTGSLKIFIIDEVYNMNIDTFLKFGKMRKY